MKVRWYHFVIGYLAIVGATYHVVFFGLLLLTYWRDHQ